MNYCKIYGPGICGIWISHFCRGVQLDGKFVVEESECIYRMDSPCLTK